MKPSCVWFVSLGFAGMCLLGSGCGGGDDIPDPGSDASAATDAAPPGRGAAPEPAPAAPVIAAPAAAPVVAAKPATPKVEEPAAEETAQAQESEKSAAPKPDTGSATAEMLAMATTPSSPPAGTGPSDGTTSGTGGAPPMGAGGQAGGRPGMMMARPDMAGARPPGAGGGGPGGMANGPGGPGGPPPNAGRPDPGAMARQMQNQMPTAMNGGRPGGPPGGGMRGQGEMANGRAGSNKPADFRNPEGAVDAFLDALADKDLTRLAEATALRAQEEATAKNRDLFRRIYDESLSESELGELARNLDGYKVAGENPQKSTGRVEVIVQKQDDNGGWSTHKMTTRREKKGWGVLDIGPKTVFKSPRFGNQPNRGAAGGGAR